MVERLASMLDYFLVQLAGPKCIDLKVCLYIYTYFIIDLKLCTYLLLGTKSREVSL